MEDIPVFLFTGFLDAGKTTFVQSLLEDKEFNNGHPTLVIQCEEGEEELQPDRFSKKGKVSIVSIDSEDRLTEGHLLALTKQYKPARIISPGRPCSSIPPPSTCTTPICGSWW